MISFTTRKLRKKNLFWTLTTAQTEKNWRKKLEKKGEKSDKFVICQQTMLLRNS